MPRARRQTQWETQNLPQRHVQTQEIGRQKTEIWTDCPARGTSCAPGIRRPQRHLPRARRQTQWKHKTYPRGTYQLQNWPDKRKATGRLALRRDPLVIPVFDGPNFRCPGHADRHNGKQKLLQRHVRAAELDRKKIQNIRERLHVCAPF